jgi:dihydrofolate reductase
MRKLIMWNIISLDGYFEGEKKWELPFHETVWGPELERFSIEQLESADYLVFGRVTFEGMAAYWTTAEGEIAGFMNKLPKILCSQTLTSAEWQNSTLIRTNVAAEIKKLKSGGNGDMYVFGSANLSETLIRENLFDEYRICVAPVIAGKGGNLFPGGLPEKKLSLISAQQLQNGGVILRYHP